MKIPITVRFLGGAEHTMGVERVQVELDERLEVLLSELNHLFNERLNGTIGTEYLVTINRSSIEFFRHRATCLKAGDTVAVIAPFVGG